LSQSHSVSIFHTTRSLWKIFIILPYKIKFSKLVKNAYIFKVSLKLNNCFGINLTKFLIRFNYSFTNYWVDKEKSREERQFLNRSLSSSQLVQTICLASFYHFKEITERISLRVSRVCVCVCVCKWRCEDVCVCIWVCVCVCLRERET